MAQITVTAAYLSALRTADTYFTFVRSFLAKAGVYGVESGRAQVDYDSNTDTHTITAWFESGHWTGRFSANPLNWP